MSKFSDLVTSFRRFVDDDDSFEDELPSTNGAERPNSKSQIYLVQVARALGEEIDSHTIVGINGGVVYVPERFAVSFSPKDERFWTGKKRQVIQQQLHECVVGRVRELCSDGVAIPEAINIEFDVDATLAEGEVSVRAIIDETDDLTEVSQFIAEDLTEVYIPGATGTALYALEIHNSVSGQTTTVPITKQKIDIGRGSRAVHVDVPLKDTAVSRLHAQLEFDDEGHFWLTACGSNPTLISGRLVPKNVRTPLTTDDTIKICDFAVQIACEDR